MAFVHRKVCPIQTRLVLLSTALVAVALLVGCVRLAFPHRETEHRETAHAIYSSLQSLSDEEWATEVVDVTIAGNDITVWAFSDAPLGKGAYLDAEIESVLQARDEQVYRRVIVRDENTGTPYGSFPLHRHPSAGDEFDLSDEVRVRIPRGWLGSFDSAQPSLSISTDRGGGARLEAGAGQVDREPGAAQLPVMRQVPAFDFQGLRVDARLKHAGREGKFWRDKIGQVLGVDGMAATAPGSVAVIRLRSKEGTSVELLAEFNEVPKRLKAAQDDRAVVEAILGTFLVSGDE